MKVHLVTRNRRPVHKIQRRYQADIPLTERANGYFLSTHPNVRSMLETSEEDLQKYIGKEAGSFLKRVIQLSGVTHISISETRFVLEVKDPTFFAQVDNDVLSLFKEIYGITELVVSGDPPPRAKTTLKRIPLWQL